MFIRRARFFFSSHIFFPYEHVRAGPRRRAPACPGARRLPSITYTTATQRSSHRRLKRKTVAPFVKKYIFFFYYHNFFLIFFLLTISRWTEFSACVRLKPPWRVVHTLEAAVGRDPNPRPHRVHHKPCKPKRLRSIAWHP